jgi:hypothetical protein
MTRTASRDPLAVALAARPFAAFRSLQVFTFAVASVIVALTLLQGATSLPPSGAALLVTAVPTFLAPVFWSGGLEPRRELLGNILDWAIVVLLLTGIAWLGFGVRFALAPLGLVSLVALGILVAAHQSTSVIEAVLQGMGVHASTARDGSAWTVTAVLWLAVSTPLWLGPVADLSARQEPMAPTVILACSPLAHLAAAAGHDVLRGEWFYAHSSLGSLQVDYPRSGTLLITYLLLAAALSLLLAPVRRWSQLTARRVSPNSPGESGS